MNEGEGTYATAINPGANGAATEIAGYYYDAGDIAHGFVYNGSLTTINNSSFVDVTDPNMGSYGGTYVTGINDSGEVVGYYFDANDVPHGFAATPDSSGNYDPNAFTDINDPLAVHGTYASGVNDAGEIVGYYYDANYDLHGFIYNDGTYLTLDDPSAADGTYPSAVNNSGQVVGFIVSKRWLPIRGLLGRGCDDSGDIDSVRRHDSQ